VLIECDYRSGEISDQGIPIITGKSIGKLRSGLSEVQPIQRIGFEWELKLLYMPAPARIQPVRAARNPIRKMRSIIRKYLQ
jgi:hypothetical protein